MADRTNPTTRVTPSGSARHSMYPLFSWLIHLQILEADSFVDVDRLRQFLLSTQDSRIGGFAKFYQSPPGPSACA